MANLFEKQQSHVDSANVMETRDHSNGVSPKNHRSRGNKIKKCFLIFVAVLGFGVSVNAQDVIILKNGDDIQAIVQEIGENEIKYKKFDNANGPVYTMKKSEIFMIRYPNGSKDVFTDVSTTTPAPAETNVQDNVSATAENKGNPYKFRMYIGTGSGHSYGTAGTSLEARFNGLGIHAGVGWMPHTDIAWSAGVKWYVWKNLYVDTMVGVIGEYGKYYYYDSYYDYYYDYDYKSIIGASEMFGVNWSWGGNVRFGVNAGVGFAYGFNYNLFTFAYDVGISISFGTK